jgi:DNA invertase Pin-like site-specific DNA recombinase
VRRDGRTELQVLLIFLRRGDTLVVTRIDRLARSLKDLQDIVLELKEKGVKLKATEQPIDTATAAGKAFLVMLGVFADDAEHVIMWSPTPDQERIDA